MTLEDMLRAQRNHAMDAAAQLAVTVEQQKAEIAALKDAQPEVPVVQMPQVAACPTCQGEGLVPQFHSRGSGGPPGLALVPCPTCSPEPIPRQAAKVADGL